MKFIYPEPKVRCLCCGLEFDAYIEMCPRRYLSPHDQEFAKRIAELLGYKNSKEVSRKEHKEAIQQAWKERKNKGEIEEDNIHLAFED